MPFVTHAWECPLCRRDVVSHGTDIPRAKPRRRLRHAILEHLTHHHPDLGDAERSRVADRALLGLGL